MGECSPEDLIKRKDVVEWIIEVGTRYEEDEVLEALSTLRGYVEEWIPARVSIDSDLK